MSLAGPYIPLWLARLFPVLRWWPRVAPDTLRHDLNAGLTGAIVVLPQGVAFATLAGLPPEYGLYAGMVPAIIAALFGSSWHLVSGPTLAASIVLFSALNPLAEPGSSRYIELALTLTFLVGITQLAMGLARLGALVDFISHSVIVGFMAGAAILIVGHQIPDFFGIEGQRGAHFYEHLWHLIYTPADIDLRIGFVGLATMTSGILIKRYRPRWPHLLVAMLVGGLFAAIINIFSTFPIPVVGALPTTLPPLSVPDLSLETIRQLAPAALAMTLFALAEALSIARALAARSGQIIDNNQEFIGQGLSNLTGSFFSGYVATGSFNRSALNHAAGAQTPLAAVFAGLLLVGVVLLIAPLTAWLPHAAMAGILFLVAWGLIDLQQIRRILRTSRADSTVLVTTFLATLFLPLEFAILAGVILSLALYLMRTARPRVVTRLPDPRQQKRRFTSDPSLPECPQLKILRIDGSLFFGASHHIQQTLRHLEEQNPAQTHLLLLASGINFIDVAGAELLAREARHRRAQGGALYLCGLKEAPERTLRRGGYLDEIGEDHCWQSKSEAIAEIYPRLDSDICASCKVRIFSECRTEPDR